MPDSGSAADEKIRYVEIPIWCAPFNTSEYREVDIVRIEEDGLVLRADAPVQPGTILITRCRSCAAEAPLPLKCPAVRTIGIVEIKWCRQTHADAMSRAYEI